jgi:hypothetical protein
MSTATRSQALSPTTSKKASAKAQASKKRKSVPAAKETDKDENEEVDESNEVVLPGDLDGLQQLQDALNAKRKLVEASRLSELKVQRELDKREKMQQAGESSSTDKRAKRSKHSRKSAKRSKRSSSSSESGLDSDVSEDDASETSLNVSDDDSEDSASDSSVASKKRKRSKGSPRKLDVGSVLSHWRHVAKTLNHDKRSKGEIKSSLRLLYVLRKRIAQKPLKAFVEEMQLVYIRSTESVITAERFKINRASTFSTGGALDMKEVRAAARQTTSVSPPQAVTKNEEGARQTPRAGKKTGNQKWNVYHNTSPGADSSSMKCYVCNKPGHLARDCSMRVETKASKKPTKP